MKKHCIELDQTGQFSSFFLDYIQGNKALKPFYTHTPQLSSFRSAIDLKVFEFKKRDVLVKSLHSQYEGIELYKSVAANISKLADSNTFTVTTGHQLNLFTGPLYFIYKIVSTINLAKTLCNTYPENHFVPVYWMATEDHDFDEINFFKLDGKKYQWDTNQAGAVGDFIMDQSFKDFLKTVPFAAAVFKDAYSNSKTLAEAVRCYVNALFGDEGLLVVDGAPAALKAEFKKVIESDLFAHQPFEKAKSNTGKLESLGYRSQIFPREVNFFYLEKGIRERIERTEAGFIVLNTDKFFTESEMRTLIQEHPERFSPNVVLRPLYQEMILPNLAYLGGPAEVVYWLQLSGIFEYFKVPFPVILPRNFALILDRITSRKMQQMNWEVADLFVPFQYWKKDFVQTESNFDISMENERKELNQIFDQKAIQVTELDKSLGHAFEAGKIRALKILDQMSNKLRKAEERRLEVQLGRGKAIDVFVKPGGSPQERVVNMMQFYLSDEALIQKLLDCFDPLDFRMMVLEHDTDQS
jgi:bacillithiol biosynthesis cysteine-adding enzyme BshC